MNLKPFLFFIAVLVVNKCIGQFYKTQTLTDAKGYSYETVTNDPVGMRMYTLKNGLKVYLARNTDLPRVLYATTVRAGSKNEPKDNTGLAHYLEHLLFKGNNKIGTLNWSLEEPILNEIERLFEEHKKETNTDKKKIFLKLIDSLSLAASRNSIKGEYFKLAESIGAVANNATTNLEQVVYGSLVPANSLEKFFQLEKERFTNPSLRTFYTELEIVYEEFNSRQDNEFLVKLEAINKILFPTHPYAISSIGLSEHLKNPSLIAVKEYYRKYYVPNNMAVVLAGNIEFDKTLQWVEQAFGHLRPGALDKTVYPKEKPITDRIKTDLISPGNPSVFMGFRMNGIGSEDEKYLTVVDKMLQNNVAGLLNLELRNKVKLKSAVSFSLFNLDYCMHYIDGAAIDGQPLEDVEAQILSLLDKIKKGDFDESLIKASAMDIKRKFIKDITSDNLETWAARSFVQHKTWAEQLSFIDALEKITNQELAAWASRVYLNNYVIVYKKQGPATNIVTVDKPVITPIEQNDGKQSMFAIQFSATKPKDSQPFFNDYKKEIQQSKLKNGIPVSYVPNKKNELFELDIIFDMGKNNDKLIPLAVNYIDLIGTDKYPPGEWKKEFYKLGLSFRATARNTQTIFHIEGLQLNLAAGVQLLHHLFSSLKPDKGTYARYIESILNTRKANLSNKNSIFIALANHVLFDGRPPSKDIFTEEELKKISPDSLTEYIKKIRMFRHHIFYYGRNLMTATNALNSYYKIPLPVQQIPPPKLFQLTKTKPGIYFVNYEAAQAEVMLVARTEKFTLKAMALSNMFNRFVEKAAFRLVREARSLAYNVSATHVQPPDSAEYTQMEILAGTQNNKLTEALEVMTGLMKDISLLENIFNEAKQDQLGRYQNEQTSGSAIFFSAENYKRLGIHHDYRKDMYEAIQKMTFADIKNFFETNIANHQFAIIIVGNRKDIDMEGVKKFGEVAELGAVNLFK